MTFLSFIYSSSLSLRARIRIKKIAANGLGRLTTQNSSVFCMKSYKISGTFQEVNNTCIEYAKLFKQSTPSRRGRDCGNLISIAIWLSCLSIDLWSPHTWIYSYIYLVQMKQLRSCLSRGRPFANDNHPPYILRGRIRDCIPLWRKKGVWNSWHDLSLSL